MVEYHEYQVKFFVNDDPNQLTEDLNAFLKTKTDSNGWDVQEIRWMTTGSRGDNGTELAIMVIYRANM